MCSIVLRGEAKFYSSLILPFIFCTSCSLFWPVQLFIEQCYNVTRFDITDDDATFNVTPDGHPQVPSNLVPSPPRQEDSPQQQENHHAASSPLHEEAQQGQFKHMVWSI